MDITIPLQNLWQGAMLNVVFKYIYFTKSTDYSKVAAEPSHLAFHQNDALIWHYRSGSVMNALSTYSMEYGRAYTV